MKKISALLRGITSKNNGGFYFLNGFHFIRTKNKHNWYKRVCGNIFFSNVIMPSADTKILEFDQYQKPDETPFIIYADLERIIKRIDRCKNNAENLSATKVSEHIPLGFLMSRISSFRSIETKHDVYRGKDCMKNLCEFLREHTMKIINFKKKKNEIVNKRAAGIL